MGRSEEPEGWFERERAALLLRLVAIERLGFYDAEVWLRAWEAKAEELGRPRAATDFWIEGERWIDGELAAERRKAH